MFISMGLTEIVFIILGTAILLLSYVLPLGRGEGADKSGVKIDEGLIRSLVEKGVNDEKRHINDMVEETLTYSMEKTERAMERLANEKIMAINEYSDQVLESINKNHQEVIFLYDMLNDKHDKCVKTVAEADKTMKKIRQEVQDLEVTVKEVASAATGDAGQIQIEKMQRPDGTLQIERVQRMENIPQRADGILQQMEGMPQRADGVLQTEKAQEKDGEEAKKGTGPEFLPISPERVDSLNRVIQDAKEGLDGGTAVSGKKEAFGKEELLGKEESFRSRTSVQNGVSVQNEASVRSEGQGYNNNDRILRLHKLGKSKTAIARELGLGVGEVKLVIDLFEQAK